MEKYVYNFAEGNKDMNNILGGKGANLAEMTALGLPVPEGFTISTVACNLYYEKNGILPPVVVVQILNAVHELERQVGKVLGDKNNPLLVSVRSGAPISMPGMMDTVLNLGLNDEIVLNLAKTNERFAYDSYRRLIQMYADVVKGYPNSAFEKILDEKKQAKKVKSDHDLDAKDLIEITNSFKKIYKDFAKEDFPQDPKVQLIEAVTAVFRSWNNDRAIYYRKMNNISANLGTAVNVQRMVYGNKGENCGTGVAFTRNPASGENKLYGEYLMNAQGEDVVAGIRTPKKIATLKETMPAIYEEFEMIAKKLEEHYRDMQDMEFTIEDGKLYMLQTRNGKRTAHAALKIAVDMVKEGKLTKEEALLKVEPKQLDQLLHPIFNAEEVGKEKPIAVGLAASPGAASGKIYFNIDDVITAFENGEDAILVRLETSPEDIEGMQKAKGVLTIRGGMTSHAAVVARGMGRCCICGCEDITIDEVAKTLKTKDGITFHEGDEISLDGTTGFVYGKKIAMEDQKIAGDFKTFMKWADEVRTLGVKANADTPKDALEARNFGAEGIGLCRTEHMFFEPDRIFNFQKMIVADTLEKRKEALEKILPYQQNDFEKLFEVMDGYPVIIRYLDPPLHEFLPKTEEEISLLSKSLKITKKSLRERIASLKEQNPMMGHRGCRLLITYPEIARMQTTAVIKAAIQAKKKNINVSPEIMIPLVGDLKEFNYLKTLINEVAAEIERDSNEVVNYKVGTMIEVPRAALLADEIAKSAQFFSFGTNDLTQMTYGFSRDDAGKFLDDYQEKKIFENDPFKHIDEKGVGTLIKMARALGKRTNPKLELGICGEHGGDPDSVMFCHKAGLDYVSCSPYRVPIARLAAAQASIRGKVNN